MSNNAVPVEATTPRQVNVQVPGAVIPKVVDDAFRVLTNDPNFVKKLETSVANILKDGKIDQYDIPEFILIITDAYNTMSQVKLEADDLPLLIKLIYNYMVDNLNLIPDDKRPEFERLVDSALRLVMLNPVVNKKVNSCLGKLFSCCS